MPPKTEARRKREAKELAEGAIRKTLKGLIPHGCKDHEGGRKPINARAESVARLPTFRPAYAKRAASCPSIVSSNGMRSRVRGQAAFCCSDERSLPVWHCRFVGELAASAERRMDSHLHDHYRAGERAGRANSRPHAADPAKGCLRWLSSEPDPNDLLAPFPAKLMVMWPVSTRINRPENDDASLLDPAIGGGYVRVRYGTVSSRRVLWPAFPRSAQERA